VRWMKRGSYLTAGIFAQGVASISPASASPLGSVNESSTRKLLINLILTLNNTFTDYDFRDLKPEDFVREASLDLIMTSVNNRLSRVDDATSSEFCTKLWAGLTSEMALRDCEIYSYVQASRFFEFPPVCALLGQRLCGAVLAQDDIED
jgi:hypothetical protein